MCIRDRENIIPSYKVVDTCAAEFVAQTPYCYSTYDEENEIKPIAGKKVMILGGGPNRIGQGIEFDYCCVQAVFGLKDQGYKTIMVNCNPETVSTDFDLVDRLYFEPVTFEDVLNVVEFEKPDGVLVQFGGQTPLKLALGLQGAGVNVIGTSPDSIDLAEDRKRFTKLLWELGIPQPPNDMASSGSEARQVAKSIGFPVLVRPSYVLGGRAMAIVFDSLSLDRYMESAVAANPGHPVVIDKFLEDAVEIDVDVLADSSGAVVVGGIMEHIEEAGIHSGDSSCVIPPYLVADRHLKVVRDYACRIARALKAVSYTHLTLPTSDLV